MELQSYPQSLVGSNPQHSVKETCQNATAELLSRYDDE